ncbi:hypothetical protein, variant [Aphanomyces invadans]|uniref:Trimethylguanosine synthase n=1 Tax=Aphanomyces invadans TaxID=157072 RepID=A0A024TP05_9STRA|nr:hypothetical protein, variant [Aphanomyces invadans]ETV95739.1 hypothetical protein, variant [Aphanomyces invadans]|eukprot:XP_008875489.1 hypothetical protein, variant [Aphanomyces invadans]
MAITFRNVYLFDLEASARQSHAAKNSKVKPGKKRKQKHRKRNEAVVPDPFELAREAEEAAQQKLLQDEMDAVGMAGMLPLSFGSTKQQTKPLSRRQTPQYITFDDDGEGVEVDPPVVPILRKRPLDEETPVEEDDAQGTNAAVLPPHKKPTRIHPSLQKYWAQRYALFSKFDDGIEMDHEGWFSVTPEVIAAHHATRIACDVVVDAFTGCGGNAIQLARTCRHVIAIDLDPTKIAIAKHNAGIYGVADRIEWIVGDSFAILPRLHHVDVVFLSPPWGGPAYLSQQKFSLQDMRMGRHDGIDLFKIATALTKDIVYFVPRNVDTKQVKLLQDPERDEVVEVEYNYLNHKLKTVTMYFGSLACRTYDADVEGSDVVDGEQDGDEDILCTVEEQ